MANCDTSSTSDWLVASPAMCLQQTTLQRWAEGRRRYAVSVASPSERGINANYNMPSGLIAAGPMCSIRLVQQVIPADC